MSAWWRRRPIVGEVLRSEWLVGCECSRRAGVAGWPCGCSWYGWESVAHLIFLVLDVREAEQVSATDGSAWCLALDYDLQEEMSSTAAYSFRVGEPFLARERGFVMGSAEAVSA